MSDTVRGKLLEIAQAARWSADQPNPRTAITGYSWFNVTIEELDKLVPDRLSVESQVSDAIRASSVLDRDK